MATLTRQNDKLVVVLSTVEKAEAVRGGFEIPLRSVRRVEAVEDPIKEVHGFRPSRVKLYGMYIPGETAVGLFLRHGLKGKPAFIAVHHNDTKGVRITLGDAKYSELLIGCDDPEAIVRLLSA